MKFKIVLIFLTFLFSMSLNPVYGASGIFLDIRVEEGIPQDSASFELIDQREIRLLNGFETASFQANFTLYTTPTMLDSENVILNLTLITLPPRPQPIFTEILAKDEETYFFGEVKAKQGRVYRVYLTPRITEMAEPDCDVDTRDKESEDWDELPSSHFFFRYILNSLADLHWAKIKGYAETEYRHFQKTFGFTQPAMNRMEYFLLPCRASEVMWDDRFDMGLDPVKNKIYAIYNLFERSLDSPGVGFLLFYRLWGYAPPMLAEGIGGYFSLSHHFTKKLIATNRWVSLKKLKITRDYRGQPKDVAFWESCSFVRFLVKTYYLDKFKLLYERATDLTLEQAIEEVYQKNLAALEKEWLSFLEEYQDTIVDFYYFASLKMNNRHYDEAIELYQDMLVLYGKDPGTLRSLAYVYYLKGDYDQSERFYQEVLSGDTLNLEYLYILGNIKSVKGEYDEAKSYYLKVISLDSGYVESHLKLAKLQITNGDLLFAKERFEQAQGLETGTQDKMEIYAGLGTIYEKLGKAEKAQESFQNALFYARRFVFEYSDRPIPYLKLGESFFNVGEIDSAINFFQIAEFLEDRPLYRGRVLLALGKAYQEKNDVPKAKMFLQEVLNLPTGFEERKEAEKLLKSM
ncbi:MAG: tetratricopeptide repeat protein [candidate division Zixibacteria bacterium]|nr:tetratricopeptide repeat protein [candidate division Zixibacteria bacterium]